MVDPPNGCILLIFGLNMSNLLLKLVMTESKLHNLELTASGGLFSGDALDDPDDLKNEEDRCTL
jgi:hypothetical protein